ncbi:hypothetical protein RJ639_047020 [Escallonia herrerae]|uniref:Uncharacterized protein n=1 Tax=Escallonia herrerae TaxID=1293975 RepID=A0AA89B0X9_9ASTE|nr:hypothetical protein RJ639_047020 [Escallonia herrerae]
MASIFSMAGAGLSALRSPPEGRFGAYSSPSPPFAARPRRIMVAVRAEAINPEIRKTEDKVVDSVVVLRSSIALAPFVRSRLVKMSGKNYGTRSSASWEREAIFESRVMVVDH